MSPTIPFRCCCALLVACLLCATSTLRADVITEWNTKACEIAVSTKVSPPAYRVMACVQTAVYEAVNAITEQYPRDALSVDPVNDASVEAAVAAANRTVLIELVPSQAARVDSFYHTALASIPDGPQKDKGIALGERAATLVCATRREDGADILEQYRPVTSPGVYVATTVPVVPNWPQRKPWVLSKPDQYRPGPPPDLNSEVWARDFNEIKALGARQNSTRSEEQSAIAHFWEATAPPIYFGVVQSVATSTERDITRNARFLAVAAQAIDDVLVAVMDAKYHYSFWRPITAIRNGDIDGNDATERDASWLPFAETPMHPEYPCAHCAVASAVGAVIETEVGNGAIPVLRTTSPAAPGEERTWNQLSDLIREVESARIYDGVHFRNSTEAGSRLGKQVGELVAARALQPEPVTEKR